MKPFADITQEAPFQKRLVRRSAFLRILRRIAELSGVQLSPALKGVETTSGVSYTVTAPSKNQQWGVKRVSASTVKVGYGVVMMDGEQGYHLLSAEDLTVGTSGYVGISASAIFSIGPSGGADIRADWMGWIEVTASPHLAFKATPHSSVVAVDYALKTSDAAEIFIPIAHIENGKVTNLIRDGVTIRLVAQGAFPQPLYSFVLT